MDDSPSQLPGLPGFDPNNIQPWNVAVVISVTLLALFSVVIRLLSRHVKKQSLWWDDYMIIFSMIWNLLVVGFIFAMYVNGMGKHADKVPMDNIVLMAKWLVVAEIFYAWNLVWTKLSLLLMYARIFPLNFIRRVSIGIAAFVMAWGVTITFLFIFICVPVEKLWYPQLPGHCINQVATWIANAISTILTDLVILLLPIPQVWKLQLRQAEKIGLTVAFGLGFFVVFASTYRTTVLFTYSDSDPTYTLAPTVGWTAIEMSAGIVSACLPTMRPALQHLARKCGIERSIFGTGTNVNKSKDQSYNLGSATGAQLTVGGSKMHPAQQSQIHKPQPMALSSREELVDGKSGAMGSSTTSHRISSSGSSRGSIEYAVSGYPGHDGRGNEVPVDGANRHKDFARSPSLGVDQKLR